MRLSEFKRQRRLVGFYLSAHTSIAQRMRRRRSALVAGIIVLSVIATSLAFADEERHLNFVLSASLPTWAGILSAIVFILALFDLLFGWERSAAEHEDAARRLDPLAAIYRGIKPEGDDVDTGDIDLEREYWSVLDSIARIPNRDFARLKAQHLHKIEISKALDDYPNASSRAIGLKLRWRDTVAFFRARPAGSTGPATGAAETAVSDSPPPSRPAK